MWLQRWLFLSLILMKEFTHSLDSFVERGHYRGDIKTLHCNFNQVLPRTPFDTWLQLMVENNQTKFYDLCYIYYEKSQPIATSVHPAVKRKDCQDVMRGKYLRVDWPLYQAGNYKCAVNGKPSSEVVLSVDMVKVCPTKIIKSASLSDEIFYTNEQVNISCKSEGGFPESQFSYSPRRVIFERISTWNNRENIRCTDITHHSWCPLRSEVTTLHVYRDSVGVKSRYHPYIYADKPVVFRCSYRRGPSIKNQFLSSLGIIEHYEDVVLGRRVGYTPPKQKYFPVCRMFDVGAKAYPVNDQLLNTDGICAKAVERIERGLPGKISIPWKWRRDSSYSCAMYFNNTLDTSSLVQINTGTVAVLPESLSINVNNGEDIYVGDTVVINCISAGGYPAPNFEYRIDERNHPQVFTATIDHHNKIASCYDLSHTFYYRQHPDTPVLSQRQKLIVYYAVASGNFNNGNFSKSEEVGLECWIDAYVPEQANFIYIWTADGVEQNRTLTDSLTISFRGNESETWNCGVESSNKRLQVSNVFYYVNWD